MSKKLYEQLYMPFVEERTKELLEEFNTVLHKVCEDACFYTDPENLADVDNSDVFVALHLDYCDPTISGKVTHILKKYGWIEEPSIEKPQYSYLVLTSTGDIDGELEIAIQALSKLIVSKAKQLFPDYLGESMNYNNTFSKIYEGLYADRASQQKSDGLSDMQRRMKNRIYAALDDIEVSLKELCRDARVETSESDLQSSITKYHDTGDMQYIALVRFNTWNDDLKAMLTKIFEKDNDRSSGGWIEPYYDGDRFDLALWIPCIPTGKYTYTPNYAKSVKKVELTAKILKTQLKHIDNLAYSKDWDEYYKKEPHTRESMMFEAKNGKFIAKEDLKLSEEELDAFKDVIGSVADRHGYDITSLEVRQGEMSSNIYLKWKGNSEFRTAAKSRIKNLGGLTFKIYKQKGYTETGDDWENGYDENGFGRGRFIGSYRDHDLTDQSYSISIFGSGLNGQRTTITAYRSRSPYGVEPKKCYMYNDTISEFEEDLEEMFSDIDRGVWKESKKCMPRSRIRESEESKKISVYDFEDAKEYAKAVEENCDLYVKNIEQDRDGGSVLVADRNSDFSAWMDYWPEDAGEMGMDWNAYIFNTSGIEDMGQKACQENSGITSDAYDLVMSEVYCTNPIKESRALPGGMIGSGQKTSYEDKLQQRQKTFDSVKNDDKIEGNLRMYDRDCGQNGYHNSNDGSFRKKDGEHNKEKKLDVIK